MSRPSVPLPALDLAAGHDPWPLPPFAWRHVAPEEVGARPCRLELSSGERVEGELVEFDAGARCLRFRAGPTAPAVVVRFERLRLLTLATPLLPARRKAGAPVERVPAVAQEREVRLHCSGGRVWTGRTAGHVETDAGLYLFKPRDEERSLQRLFVPRCAYLRCEFGPSAEEVAAARRISTPRALLDALERQRHAPIVRIGEALLSLGLVTTAQLDRALARQRGDLPLGQMLVAEGIISKADLETALAHKMGHPLVDLTRFPIDRSLVRMLPLRLAMQCRALPLLTYGQRLVVATDRPSRIDKLRGLHVFTGLKLAPVLASKSQLVLMLSELVQQDAWSHNVFARVAFAPTTL